MSKGFLVFLGVGLAVVAVFVGIVLFSARGGHIELRGSIQKVRTMAADENSSIVVVDFRFVNPADYPFVVRTIEVKIEGKDGKTTEGSVISEVDAKKMFEYYPLLGQKYNDSLLSRERIAPHQQLDKMTCARFEIPEAQVQARRKLIIRVEDVDGAVSEIAQ